MYAFTTAEKVAAHLRVSGDPGTDIVDAVAAVNELLSTHADLLEVDEDGELAPTSSAQLGATMLGARLVRRRNSPAGLEQLDGGVASYVARTDPDIARLLRWDAFTPPAVG